MDQWPAWQWVLKAVVALAVAVSTGITFGLVFRLGRGLGLVAAAVFLVADGVYTYWRFQRDSARQDSDTEKRKSSWSEPLG
jgi:hypothetical protein